MTDIQHKMQNMDQNAQSLNLESLSFPLLLATDAAARASAKLWGRGHKEAADQAAVDAMRQALGHVDANIRVVIGEGERDRAPMLYIGETLGSPSTPHAPLLDVAVDPLEGTNFTADGKPGALSVLAIAPRGGLLHAPDVHMDKMAIGPHYPEDCVDLDAPLEENLYALAKAKGVRIEELGVCLLNRPRHQDKITIIRKAGARVHLIDDGDVAGVLSTVLCPEIDIYVGSGGAPEGVLAAVALSCLDGFMQGRLLSHDVHQRERAKEMGVDDFNHKYTIQDMVHGPALFLATGVSDGRFVRGIQKNPLGTESETLILMNHKKPRLCFFKNTTLESRASHDIT